MGTSRSLETGLTSPGDTTEAKKNVFRRITDRLSRAYFASYTPFRARLDPQWKAFLGNKHVDNGKFLTQWSAWWLMDLTQSSPRLLQGTRKIRFYSRCRWRSRNIPTFRLAKHLLSLGKSEGPDRTREPAQITMSRPAKAGLGPQIGRAP